MPDLSGKTALVTGASSGIGAAFARRLASWRCDLVISARRQERLDALAAELRAAHPIDVRVVREDLADPAGADRLYEAATADRPVDILLNNAGIAAFEYFVDVEWPRHQHILQLDVVSLCHLAYRASRDMLRRGQRAYILNVASTAAVAPVEGFAVYGGAKSFVLNFSMALGAELSGTPVSVTTVAPGPVASEFMDTAGMQVPSWKRRALLGPQRCADLGLKAMLRGRRVVYPGTLAKLMAYGSRLGPARLNGAVGGLLLGRPAAARREPG